MNQRAVRGEHFLSHRKLRSFSAVALEVEQLAALMENSHVL